MSENNQIIIPKSYLDQISPIKTDSLFYLQQAEKIKVSDDISHRQGAELRKEVVSFLNSTEKKRKEITKPILDLKKAIDKLAKESLDPAEKAKQVLTEEITKYENELAEKARIEKARIDKIKNVFLLGELKPTLEANQEMLKKVQGSFQTLDKNDQENPEILEACNGLCERIKLKIQQQHEAIEAQKEADRLAKIKATQDKEALELAKKQAEIDNQKRKQLAEQQRLNDEKIKQEIARKKMIAEKQKESMRVKTGLKERTTFEITDPNLVPRELCSPDEKLIRQAIKEGKTEILGVKIFKVKS